MNQTSKAKLISTCILVALAATGQPAAGQVTYHGTSPNGKVVQSPQIVQVIWNNGSGSISSALRQYLPELLDAFAATVGWMSEYNVTGRTPQLQITAGKLVVNSNDSYGGFVISVQQANRGSEITESQIQQELYYQISNGYLPAASSNTIYLVDFPSGVIIDDATGNKSCTACTGHSCSYQGWCGLHSSVTISGTLIRYGLVPDYTASNSYCGYICALSSPAGTGIFDASTANHVHEAAETITDPDDDAWWHQYGANTQEIGDLCVGQASTIALGDSTTTYYIQKLWSNSHGNQCYKQCDYNSSQMICGGFGSRVCANILSDPSNCGGCGTTCSAPANGSPYCSNGGCNYSCNSGYSACGGACVNEQSDNSNCGGCGYICHPGHATQWQCISGECDVLQCASGYHNCQTVCYPNGTPCP